MARKQKPVKIKRYKNSMGTSTSSVYKIKQLIPVIGIVLALVLVGFLLGKPLLAMLSGAGDDSSSSQPDTSSQPVVSQPVESQPQPEPSEIPDNSENNVTVPPVIQKTKVYYYADVNLLTTENGIDSVISQMQAKNATHLVFDLKNKDGNLLYASQNQYGSQLVADKTVDLSLLTAKLSAADITPVARIYTFMDKMISTVERSTAVMYQGTDTRCSDLLRLRCPLPKCSLVCSKVWCRLLTRTPTAGSPMVASTLLRLSARPFFVTTFATLCPKSIFIHGETLSRRWLHVSAVLLSTLSLSESRLVQKTTVTSSRLPKE